MKGTQTTLAAGTFETHRKATRRDVFLTEMDRVVPWSQLCALIEHHYPRTVEGAAGRPPIDLEQMLRIHFLQQWYSLSDPAVEEALYDSHAMRGFVGIDLGRESVPDETTVCKFRHLLERHGLGEQLFKAVMQHLQASGIRLSKGTIVDATIIAAPPSTKNRSGERDPEMHQTKKGNQWHFGMKAHIGVDAESGLVHAVAGTAANVHDLTPAGRLLHGKETDVHIDAGYAGIQKREELRGIKARWHVAMRPGTRRALPDTAHGKILRKLEVLKASIRAKVEHPFRVIKRQFGYVKVRYRGLAKNTAQLHTLFALSNLWMVRRRLMAEA